MLKFLKRNIVIILIIINIVLLYLNNRVDTFKTVKKTVKKKVIPIKNKNTPQKVMTSTSTTKTIQTQCKNNATRTQKTYKNKIT